MLMLMLLVRFRVMFRLRFKHNHQNNMKHAVHLLRIFCPLQCHAMPCYAMCNTFIKHCDVAHTITADRDFLAREISAGLRNGMRSCVYESCVFFKNRPA